MPSSHPVTWSNRSCNQKFRSNQTIIRLDLLSTHRTAARFFSLGQDLVFVGMGMIGYF